MTRLPRSKTNAFRVLTYALYAQADWVSRLSDGFGTSVEIKVPQMRRQLQIQSDRFHGHLEWLQERGFIRALQRGRGWANFVVRHPNTWNWSGDSDGPDARAEGLT